MRVQPDVVEDLGSESHVIFTLDAPRVTAEAVRAATDEARRRGQALRGRPRRLHRGASTRAAPVASGAEVELAVDCRRLHFFDPATGLALAGTPRSSVVASYVTPSSAASTSLSRSTSPRIPAAASLKRNASASFTIA